VTKEELKKIIQDRCSEKNRFELIDWILSKNFDQQLDQFISKDLEQELLKPHKRQDPELDAICEQIIQAAPSRQSKSDALNHEIDSYPNGLRRPELNTIFKVAAAILVLAVFSFIAYFFTENQSEEVQVVQTITKENQRGRKSTIFLQDGSIIYLNSESSITYPEVFSDSLREVHLQGEAYFEILKNEIKPFVVYSNDIKISVLGTSFNVHAFAENDVVKVSLSTGRVKLERMGEGVGKNNESIELQPGQSVSYSEEKRSFSDISTFDPNLELGWKDGKLVFKDASMEKMINRLERWYNVDFVLKNDPYFRWNYTGEFQNQTLLDVLESLSFSQSFDFDLKDDKVELIFKPI
jgi:transmembrane sensor